LIRAELEDTMARMTPAARAVFEDIRRMDEDAQSELPEGFDALTPPERTSVIEAAKLLEKLAEAEAAEDADDQKLSVGVSRLRRRLWIVSALISIACLIVLGGMWVDAYTAPSTPDPADTVVTTPEEVTGYLDAYVPAPEPGDEPPVFIPTGLYIESVEFRGPYDVLVSGYLAAIRGRSASRS
jgi:glutathione S-transferase